ncbi:alpha/beta hydrolase [Marinicella sp. W31]|uniref:alpha/beta hydrolase n=1 Tax=Marinicella sp. W31 TaxID=3023713 RepID=UPI003757F7A2
MKKIIIAGWLLTAFGSSSALEMENCHLSDPTGLTSVRAECGYVSVPENRTNTTKNITLKLAIIRTSSKKKKDDPVLMLAGGPGQSALESYTQAEGGFQSILRHRDVVLVDQRGTGSSNALDCQFDMTEAISVESDAWRDQLIACRDSLDADLAEYTTTAVVEDLEDVRKALGIEKWNLIGVSYGSRKALTYMRMYPQSLRSVILDGVVPQQEPLGLSHDANISGALVKQFELCQQQPACAEAFGDGEAKMWSLLNRLEDSPINLKLPDPISGKVEDFTLSKDYAAMALRMFAYSPESMRLIPLLVSLAEEDQPENLAAQAKMIEIMLTQGLSNALEISVICTEDEPFYRNLPVPEKSLFGNDFVKQNEERCDLWPHQDVDPSFKEPVVSDIPTLLLSGELDPVTPPRFAETTMQTLSRSQHLVAKGQGHNVFVRGCMPRIVSNFIRDPEAELDTECMKSFDYTPFFVNLMGPQE